MTGRATEIGAISAVAFLLTLVLAAPVLREPSARIFGKETVGRHHDPFTAMQQFARPITLGIYSQPVTDVPGALIARTTNPVAAYNWLVLLTFPLSAAAAFALARHLTLSPAASAMAALAFAFSPFHLAQAAYHPHVAQTQWLPLYFLALWRCLDNSTLVAIAFLAASSIGVALSNFYGGLIAGVLTPVAIGAYWWCTSPREPRSVRPLLVTIGVLGVMAVGALGYGWFAAPAVVVDPGSFGASRNDLFRYSAKWWSYFVPPLAHPSLGEFAARVWQAVGVQAGALEQQVSLGWAIVALGLVALVAWVLRGGHQRSLTIVPVLASVAAVALVCSLSPERTVGSFTFVRPSALLFGVLPMFRAYARFAVVVQLMAALLAGIGAERLWRMGTRSARGACVALVVVAIAEYAVWPPALWRDVLPTQAHRWAAEVPGAVRVLDCAPFTQESESVRWLTGYRVTLRRGSFDDCTEPNFADKLSASGYTHLLVRGGTSEARWFAGGRGREGLHSAARFGDGEVLAVTAATPPVYTFQMRAFGPREYDETWTWRWMGPEASWIVVNRTDRPIVVALDAEMSAFHGARRLEILLDGRHVQTLLVGEHRRLHRIEPLALTPGDHQLTFHPADPPTVADAVMNNGDRRPLSFALGTWHWDVQGTGE
jgi:hypothetical protein